MDAAFCKGPFVGCEAFALAAAALAFFEELDPMLEVYSQQLSRIMACRSLPTQTSVVSKWRNASSLLPPSSLRMIPPVMLGYHSYVRARESAGV